MPKIKTHSSSKKRFKLTVQVRLKEQKRIKVTY